MAIATSLCPRALAAGLALAVLGCAAPHGPREGAPPAAEAFARLTALEGSWVDTSGTMGPADKVLVTYRTSGSGSAVVETLFPGEDHEMVTVYHKDGPDLVLTHYCGLGNQPRMRATTVRDNVLEFQFDGGLNIDPAKDTHMHSARLEFVSRTELRSRWVSWEGGRVAEGHTVEFSLRRVEG